MFAMYETARTDGGPVQPPQEIAWEDLDEVLRHDFRDESAFRISAAYLCCPYCARLGETMDEIQHDAECPFAAVDDF